MAELERVAGHGDDEFFALNQPQYRNGRPTLRTLADEIMELRTKMKPPVTRCAAAEFLMCCISWSLSTAGARLSSAIVAKELLGRVQNENDG